MFRLRVEGVGGRLTPPQSDEDGPKFSADLGAAIRVSGSLEGIELEASVTGHDIGTIETPEDLKDLVDDRTLAVTVNRFSVPGEIQSLTLRGMVTGLAFREDENEGPTVEALHGEVVITPDPASEMARMESLSRVRILVAPESPIVLDGSTEGPSSGRVQIDFTRFDSRSQALVLTFVDGKPVVEARLRNETGEDETVSTEGDTTVLRGQVRFRDGKTSEHTVRVTGEGTSRTVTFVIRIRNSDGTDRLEISGIVATDDSVSGSFTDHARGATGLFRSRSDGTIEIQDLGGIVVARADVSPGEDRAFAPGARPRPVN